LKRDYLTYKTKDKAYYKWLYIIIEKNLWFILKSKIAKLIAYQFGQTPSTLRELAIPIRDLPVLPQTAPTFSIN
jgi:hypothetical protein